MPVASPCCPLSFCPTGYRSEVPTTPSPEVINLLERLTELREAPMLTSSLRNMVKDTDEHPDGRDTQRCAGSGGAPMLSRCHPPSTSTCSPNLGALWTPYFGDFMEVSSHRHNPSLPPFSALLPYRENGGRAGNSKLLIIARSFWWPALIQEPTQSHLIRTKYTPITQEFQGFRESCVRNRAQRPTTVFHDLTVTFQEQGSWGHGLMVEWGAEGGRVHDCPASCSYHSVRLHSGPSFLSHEHKS